MLKFNSSIEHYSCDVVIEATHLSGSCVQTKGNNTLETGSSRKVSVRMLILRYRHLKLG